MAKVILIKKIPIFLLGLFFMGMGVALVTKSNLGTSPITSVPYVLSMIFPLTLGQFTLLLNVLFLLMQIILLGKKFPKKQYLQLLVGPFFGYFIDFGMHMFSFVNPAFYVEKIIFLLLGCIVLALGVYVQVKADLIVNPGEGIVLTIANKLGKEFGTVKIVFDFSLMITGAVISLFAFGAVKGIREGTVISAFLIGFIIRMISQLVRRMVSPFESAKLQN